MACLAYAIKTNVALTVYISYFNKIYRYNEIFEVLINRDRPIVVYQHPIADLLKCGIIVGVGPAAHACTLGGMRANMLKRQIVHVAYEIPNSIDYVIC